ncbi:hypothetical protein, partial [Aeromonas hydrophila]|uniref:hypothetical protein n=1 Tax=Aeromonas hydrophila TaxID=644 RepID=UPI0039F4FE08
KKDAVPAGRKMVIGMMLLADRHDVISQTLTVNCNPVLCAMTLFLILLARCPSQSPRHHNPPLCR